MTDAPLRGAPGGTTAAPTRRQAYEARLKRRSNTDRIGSTLAVVLAVVVLVPLAPGWEAVKALLLQRGGLRGHLPGPSQRLHAGRRDLPVVCALIALTGLLIALCRDVRSPALFPLRMFGAAYTDIFRGLPVILVVYLVGFGIPGLGLPRPWNSPYIWGSLALILVYSAYVAEVIRSGIESIHQSQRSAAASLGLSEADTMRFVVLPQAIRNVAPANMNLFIALQKDVALLSFIGPVEIFRQAGVYKSLMANFTPYVGAALIFLAITIPATRYADYLMHKQRRRQR
jgi:polar amino acid transport system permease protein